MKKVYEAWSASRGQAADGPGRRRRDAQVADVSRYYWTHKGFSGFPHLSH